MTVLPRYTAKDPRFELTCEPCRYGRHECLGKLIVTRPSEVAGTYRCNCLRCRTAK